MTDICEILRHRAEAVENGAVDGFDEDAWAKDLTSAAAEIERLRTLLARYRDETPLGHQPHMIAHEVARALGRES